MKPLILVADDDELVRHNLELVLSLEGYRVAAAASGTTALEIIAEAKPDLVLLDICMPGMDGWEVIRTLREDASSGYLPVVAFTGEDIDRNSFRQAGFTAHLAKGEAFEKFLCTLRSALAIPADSPPVWLHSCNGERCLVSPAVELPEAPQR